MKYKARFIFSFHSLFFLIKFDDKSWENFVAGVSSDLGSIPFSVSHNQLSLETLEN